MESESKIASKRVLISIVMNLIITIAEIIGGILSKSLALLSDSMHNLSDTLAQVLTFATLRLSERKSDKHFTFGYKRAEIISAFINSSVLIVIAVLLIREAIARFYRIETITVGIMLPIAVIGLIANFVSVMVLHGHTYNMNLKSAYLHLLTDTLSSVVVVVGAVLMLFFNIYWLDPLLTIIIAVYMGYEAFDIFKGSLLILMECAPKEIDLQKIKEDILKIEDVENIHHVHIWMLSESNFLFEAHINIKNINIEDTKKIRLQIEDVLKKYGIDHSTIQFEYKEHLEDGLIKGSS